MSDTTPAPTPADVARPRTYTQAEVDHQIRDSLDAERTKYEATREAAERAEAAAQRITALEQQLNQARRETLVTRTLNTYGLTPDDAVLLTGDDEATLTAQAQRLQTLANQPKTGGLIARKEGQAVRRVDTVDNRQSFLTELGVSDDDY